MTPEPACHSTCMAGRLLAAASSGCGALRCGGALQSPWSYSQEGKSSLTNKWQGSEQSRLVPSHLQNARGWRLRMQPRRVLPGDGVVPRVVGEGCGPSLWLLLAHMVMRWKMWDPTQLWFLSFFLTDATCMPPKQQRSSQRFMQNFLLPLQISS